MVDVEVTTHWSKSATEDVRAALAQPMAIARATARHIQRRIRRGRTATKAQPYQQRAAEYVVNPKTKRRNRRSYYVSPAYAEAAGVPGQTRWLNSAEFHTAVNGKPGNVTGKMLDGIRARNYGRDAVVIDFAKSSLGASSVRTAIRKKVSGEFEITLSNKGKLRAKQVKEFSRDEGGAVKYRRKPKLVTNREKAGRVFKYVRVGLLQPTPGETAAQLQSVSDAAAGVVLVAFGGEIVTSGTAGDPVLLRSIRDHMK